MLSRSCIIPQLADGEREAETDLIFATSQCPLDPCPTDSSAHALTELRVRFYLYGVRTCDSVSGERLVGFAWVAADSLCGTMSGGRSLRGQRVLM